MIERGSVLLLLTMFLIFAKLVVYLPSSSFLQLINNFFLSLTEYLTVIGVTSKSFGSHQGFAKNYTFGRFPVTITTPVAFFNNYHRRSSPGKNKRTFLAPLFTHFTHSLTHLLTHFTHNQGSRRSAAKIERGSWRKE